MAEYLSNPSFTGGTTGWTLAITAYDAGVFQDTAGSIKATTPVGRNSSVTGTCSQQVATEVGSGNTVKLSLYWKKGYTSGVDLQAVKAQIALPSAPTVFIDIWSDAQMGNIDWTAVTELDVSSYFTETGTYQFRYLMDLSNPNDSASQVWAYIDNTHLDVVVGGVTHHGTATLSGLGTLAGIGALILNGLATLVGTGTVACIGVLTAVGKATLSGIGTLTGIGRRIVTGVMTLAGTGLLSAVGGVWKLGSATLTGVGTLTTNAVSTLIGKAIMAGTGALSAIGQRITYGIATLAGIGTLAVIGTVGAIQYGVVTLSGVGNLVASAVSTLIGKATLSGVGALATAGSFIGNYFRILFIKTQATITQDLNLTTLTREALVITTSFNKGLQVESKIMEK